MIHVPGYEYQANTACIACRHVIDDGREVVFVSHDEDDGTIQLMCGDTGHSTDDGRVIGFGSMIQRFPANYFPDIVKPGSRVQRVADGCWVLEQ
jgi:hypothetical protein